MFLLIWDYCPNIFRMLHWSTRSLREKIYFSTNPEQIGKIFPLLDYTTLHLLSPFIISLQTQKSQSSRDDKEKLFSLFSDPFLLVSLIFSISDLALSLPLSLTLSLCNTSYIIDSLFPLLVQDISQPGWQKPRDRKEKWLLFKGP